MLVFVQIHSQQPHSRSIHDSPIQPLIYLLSLDGGFTVKRYCHRGGRCWLESANAAFPDLEVLDDEATVWGVVTHAINRL